MWLARKWVKNDGGMKLCLSNYYAETPNQRM